MGWWYTGALPKSHIPQGVTLTGPEHYREAERLLTDVANEAAELTATFADEGGFSFGIPGELAEQMSRRWVNTIAAAQAHATLALAAASVLGVNAGGDLVVMGEHWRDVIER